MAASAKAWDRVQVLARITLPKEVFVPTGLWEVLLVLPRPALLLCGDDTDSFENGLEFRGQEFKTKLEEKELQDQKEQLESYEQAAKKPRLPTMRPSRQALRLSQSSQSQGRDFGSQASCVAQPSASQTPGTSSTDTQTISGPGG